MQKVDRAGEPTMEEILASIRQIIAEEPANGRPLVPSSSVAVPASAPSSVGGAASTAAASAAPAPTPATASAAPGANPVEAPRPAQAFTTGPALGSVGEPVKSASAGSPIAALGRLGGDLPFPLRPLGEARPNVAASAPASSTNVTTPPPASASEGLAQRTMPASDFGMFVPRRLDEALAQGGRGDQPGRMQPGEPRPAVPSSPPQPANRLAADIAALAPKSVRPAADIQPANGAAAPAGSGAPGLHANGLDGTPAAKPAAAPAAPEVAVVRPAPQPVVPPVVAAPAAASAGAAPAPSPSPAVAASKPVAADPAKSTAAAKPVVAAPVPAAAPAPAAAAASSPAVAAGATASKAVVTLAGVAEAMKAPAAAASGAVTPTATDLTPVKDAPVKTLEDAVVDLLRPMLRNWLDENMPRIVEKALRIEVAEQLKRTVPKQG